MALSPLPIQLSDAYRKPAISGSDLLSPEEGNIFQKLFKFARDIGQEGASMQQAIQEKAPYVAPITNAAIPQNTLGVMTTPLSLGTLATKAPTLVKGLAGGLQGLLNAAGSETESNPQPSVDILDQIANEGRDSQETTRNPMEGMLTSQDILAMMNSAEPAEMPKKGWLEEYTGRVLANLQGRNYDMEQLGIAQALSPQAQFQAQLPELLRFFMEQDARAARDMQVEAYKSELERNKFLEFPGLAESPIF